MTSTAFQVVDRKIREDHFAAALRDLLASGDSKKPEFQSRAAELFLRQGQFPEADQAAERGLRDPRSSSAVKAACLEVQGLLLKEDGQLRRAVQRFKSAVKEAENS